jgi:hypothetical protein
VLDAGNFRRLLAGEAPDAAREAPDAAREGEVAG